MCSVTWNSAVRLVFCGSSEVGSACRPILRMPPRLGVPAAAAATAVAAGFAAAWTVGATVAAALTAVAAAAGAAVAAAAGTLVGAAGTEAGPQADRNSAAAKSRRRRGMRASVSDDERGQVARVVRRQLDAVLGHDRRVGVAEAGHSWHVQPGLDREDHAWLDLRLIAQVEERRLVAFQTQPVARVVAGQVAQPGALDLAAHLGIDVTARAARP